ncbi:MULTISPECIES: protein-glutamate methylesterase/protein-glutamine glutaminase [unclassified Xanthobacter]|uniref:protein-glutamate methylesterase/protein-glutamine glutaminase n=1 Tax=unclassified Xanthobacter TaxID=2623496 RepID=UPI001EDF8252|nr:MULTISPECIES: chemotaxis response regulator protein-glutamate methylesterase [unclassified Xanthobacter]
MTLASSSGPAVAGHAVRVMVVDDSVFVRGILSRWLADDPLFEVVATHANGRRAVEDLERAQPDVVILDLEMPEMDGLTALPLILKQRPSTMVVVASTLTRRGAEVSLKALTLGAADYLPKPDAGRGIAATDEFKSELIAKVRSLGQKALRRSGRAPVVETRPAPATPASHRPAPAAPASRGAMPERLHPYSMSPVTILAVGSSTGGPQALTRLFTAIGPYLERLPVVITQHMPATFTAILAEHVSRAAGRPAAEGVDGEPLRPGHIYVAPGGRHMLIEGAGGNAKIRLSDGPPVNFCKPAVDPMFGSVATAFRRNVLALVLTGMGSDGAKGAGVVLDAGGSVIVQDEETCVVWGMPGATAALGNTCEVLALDAIGRKVIRLIEGGAR